MANFRYFLSRTYIDIFRFFRNVRMLIIGLACGGGLLVINAAPISASLGMVPKAPTMKPYDLSDVVYTKSDSAEVVKLLSEDSGINDVIYFARRLLGRPYVAHTLEVADSEKLVVNLQELDCTTLVETVCALTLTKRQNSAKFADYCRNLEQLRYFNGVRNGYCSRLHYFTWWMHDNSQRGWVEEVHDSVYFSQPMVVRNYYMSRYPYRYKFLKSKSNRQRIIADFEKKYNGRDGYFLPKSKTGLSREKLSSIRDGDIIAIVTNKPGLDYSHLGFAAWGQDDKLHLLNASMVKGEVIEDSQTLENYLNRYKHTKGIKVLRLR